VRHCLEATLAAAERAGLKVDRKARPAFDPEEAWQVFIGLLNAAMAPGLDAASFAKWLEGAAKLNPEDRSHRALTLRGATQRHRDWTLLQERRGRLRSQWAAFF